MIEIKHNNKIYKINKTNLLNVLSRLTSKNVKESEIENLMKKFVLYEEYFLKQINNL